jgi:hypothetical protein
MVVGEKSEEQKAADATKEGAQKVTDKVAEARDKASESLDLSSHNLFDICLFR